MQDAECTRTFVLVCACLCIGLQMDLCSNVTVFDGGSGMLSDFGGASQMEDDFVLCLGLSVGP